MPRAAAGAMERSSERRHWKRANTSFFELTFAGGSRSSRQKRLRSAGSGKMIVSVCFAYSCVHMDNPGLAGLSLREIGMGAKSTG